MEFIGWLVGSLLLAVALTVLRTRLGHGPGPKRTYLFETPEGERDNPFATAAEEETPAEAAHTCRRCRNSLPTAAYRYCPACVTAD